MRSVGNRYCVPYQRQAGSSTNVTHMLKMKISLLTRCGMFSPSGVLPSGRTRLYEKRPARLEQTSPIGLTDDMDTRRKPPTCAYPFCVEFPRAEVRTRSAERAAGVRGVGDAEGGAGVRGRGRCRQHERPRGAERGRVAEANDGVRGGVVEACSGGRAEGSVGESEKTKRQETARAAGSVKRRRRESS